MSKAKHDWVTFKNPRNGKIRIQACIKCGVAKGLVQSLHCVAVPNRDNPMRLLGWDPDRAIA